MVQWWLIIEIVQYAYRCLGDIRLLLIWRSSYGGWLLKLYLPIALLLYLCRVWSSKWRPTSHRLDRISVSIISLFYRAILLHWTSYHYTTDVPSYKITHMIVALLWPLRSTIPLHFYSITPYLWFNWQTWSAITNHKAMPYFYTPISSSHTTTVSYRSDIQFYLQCNPNTDNDSQLVAIA